MSFLKRSLLRDALAPAMESTQVTTEEVGSTAEAAVEIERLKQENLDIMEIHALEQDVALIEKYGDGVEELSYALDEVGELKASMESYLEKGGMNASDAAGVNRTLRFINRRLGNAIKVNTPASESFQGATADRITLTVATEGAISEFFGNIWEGIKSLAKRIKDTVLGWFGKSEGKLKKDKEALEEAAKVVESKNELVVKEDNIAMESVPLHNDLAAGLKGDIIDLKDFTAHKLSETVRTKKLIDALDVLAEYLKGDTFWNYIVELVSGNASKLEEAQKYFDEYVKKISAVFTSQKKLDDGTEIGESESFLGNHVMRSSVNVETFSTKYEIIQKNKSEESHILKKGSTTSAKTFANVLQSAAECIDSLLKLCDIYATLVKDTEQHLNKVDALVDKVENKEQATMISKMSKAMVQAVAAIPVPRIAQVVSNQNVRLLKIYNKINK